MENGGKPKLVLPIHLTGVHLSSLKAGHSSSRRTPGTCSESLKDGETSISALWET